ncbi:MAG TPA: BadF/BadG/BcrA/BcrD ATPase family protein, partial [Candidatus Bathyarchaeia archaeon]|nr:BadF/BadG/BcrA/BcrD ATPase family protein [Candidatus Bathyarchaeia archaeon]
KALDLLRTALATVPSTMPLVGISGPPAYRSLGPVFDAEVCLNAAVRSVFPGARNIITVGASRLVLVRLDESGRISSIHRNSPCAAGTGSFLDAQAARMGIEYERTDPARWEGDPPSIATRCAVFAKSDLIYGQQEGITSEALWSGLCRGLADGLLRTLTAGRPLSGLTVICGGVALNGAFVAWLRRRLKDGEHQPVILEVMPEPEYAEALGAAILARPTARPLLSDPKVPKPASERKKRPALELRRSRLPETPGPRPEKDAEGNEIGLGRLPESTGAGGALEAFLGLDIGSTSTKAALIDREGRILLDIYRPTGADPIAAVKKLFQAALRTARARGIRFRILGAATTGSGRKLIGPLIGADLVTNEITAHATGALWCDPGVETIVEIGGQDAKFISIRNGRVVDANMNYVCAAGTGSFIEELAARLGYSLGEIGEVVLGVEPPYSSSRCTVFMEQDLNGLLQEGLSRPEAAGAVIYSVIENYLEQVVGRRPFSRRRVFFQGATARNRGLAAALENVLGTEVVVSPYCHVLGAFGAALMVRDRMDGRPSRFRGFDLAERTVSLERENCRLCRNACRLSRAVVEGEDATPLWGMKCGRDEKDGAKRALDGFAVYEKAVRLGSGARVRPRTVGDRPAVQVPRILTAYSYFPFWQAFFDAMGVEAHLGPAADAASFARGNHFAGSELCLPVKAAIGQVAGLLAGSPKSFVFIPYMLSDSRSPRLAPSRYCPYVEALPSLIGSALGGNGLDTSRILSPLVDLRLPDEIGAESIARTLTPLVRVRSRDVRRALHSAREARARNESDLEALGREAIQRAAHRGRPALVIIGRPYNIQDERLSQDIPRFAAECGWDVIPMTCLPWDPDLLQGEFENMFWSYGQRILSALLRVARTEGLYAVYLSNFACGPDSFLLSYAESTMEGKPFLALEVDEHGSSGGYETRVEAFLEVVERDWAKTRGARPAIPPLRDRASAAELKRRTLWFPIMHPIVNRTFTAAFRGAGYRARNLPLEDEKVLALGRKWTRGSECLPAALTLGSFLSQVETDRAAGLDPRKDAALFLPTSTGPCRFGQYRTLGRLILDRQGLEEIPILSPGAHNAYYGLERSLRAKIWGGIVGGDILYRLRCRTVPYEITRGDAEEILERRLSRAERLIETGRIRWPTFLRESARDFARIPVRNERHPLVGIVGEIYVRSNPFANDRVVEAVEKLGGEAWLAPIAEWILYTAWIERYLARREKQGGRRALKLAAKWTYLSGRAHGLYRVVSPVLGGKVEPSLGEIMRAGQRMIPAEIHGESILTLGRAILFGRQGADLVVNCAPFG